MCARYRSYTSADLEREAERAHPEPITTHESSILVESLVIPEVGLDKMYDPATFAINTDVEVMRIRERVAD